MSARDRFDYEALPQTAVIRTQFPGMKLDGGGMSPMQGRVVFHQERIFRSAGGNGALAHATYTRMAVAFGLPRCIEEYTDPQCRMALVLIEKAARAHRMHLFRDVRTS